MIIDFDEQAFLQQGPGAEVRVGLSVAGIDLLDTPENGPMWWDDPIAFVVGLRYSLNASCRFGYFSFTFLESDPYIHFQTCDGWTSVYCDLSDKCARIQTAALTHALIDAEERLRSLIRRNFPDYAAELPIEEAEWRTNWLAGHVDYIVYQSPRPTPVDVQAKLNQPDAVEA